MKRVRKKESAVILASQNLEDFNIDGIREYTKPLFSIVEHKKYGGDKNKRKGVSACQN